MTKHLLPASTPTSKRTGGRTAQTAALALAGPRRRSSTRAAGDGARGPEVAAFIDECEGQALLFLDGPLALALLYARVAVAPADRFDAWRGVTDALAALVRSFAAAPHLARLAASAAERLVAARADLKANAVTK